MEDIIIASLGVKEPGLNYTGTKFMFRYDLNYLHS